MRIGFCGYATAGKDVAAQALVDERGFTKVNMSDALLRDMLILDPMIKVTDWGEGERLSSILEEYSYDEAKAEFPDFRELLQRYGTDVWRSVDPDIWVKRAIQTIEAQGLTKVVTTGIRFPNEMTGIDLLVHVSRPGVGPINGHASDAGMADVIARADLTLVNDGTMKDLRIKMLQAYDHWLVS